ncbi:hypothetical protein [Arthrobacter sp. R-11]|uniref:hypothetical protein n=1 Tax=Arthrobacter sp. R-11 TaxID=3404053 RepID=UPI003CE9194F
MKKLTTVLLAAGLLVSASACTAPKLTTKETCERLNLVVSSPGGASKASMNRIANALRPLEAVASEELQPSLDALLKFADESAKQNPDEDKLAGLTEEYQKAGAKFSELCSGA